MTGARARRSARRDSGDYVCLAGDGRRVARSRERVSEHRSQSSVRRRPGSPAASRISVRPPWRPHDCTKRESLLVFSVARASRSVSRAFAPGRASRGGLVSHIRTAHSGRFRRRCPLSPRRGGDSGRTRHTTRTGGTESPVTYTFRVAAGFEPPKLLRTRSAPAPAAWPLASGLRRRRGPSGLALAARARRAARRLDAPSTSQFLQYGNMVCHIVWYDLQWHRAVNEQSLRHGCYIHARLRRAFELFDYDNTTLHLPVRSHPVPRRSHRPHTAPPCICIRAEADPSIALRCTAES